MTKKFIIVLFFIATSLLTACGDTSDINLIGVGGEQTQTETTVVDSPNNPTEEIATATPFPTASGRIIFVSNRDGQNDLFITTPDGTQVSKLINNIAEDTTPRLSPDGTRVAFVSTANNNTDIYILNLATGSVTQVTNAPEKDASPTWSPDSRQLAFESFRDGNFEIYITNVDGSNQYRLTNDPAADTSPVWSPTTNEIAFVSNRFGNADIFLTNPAGQVFTLTTSPAPDNAPAWSPSGNFIAYQTFSGDLSNLCIIGRDGLSGRCVTSSPALYSPLVWSPDSTWLASSGNAAIHLFNIFDGTTQQISASGIEPRGAPAFSTDGLRLVFQAQFNGDMELFSALIPTNEFTQVTAFAGYDGEAIWINQ
ncbi:MAG: PD40 domain-containing protein [Anaerolineales bacterium]|nr:PD40 domain-containing protein [Anaerolineales bacterium]